MAAQVSGFYGLQSIAGWKIGDNTASDTFRSEKVLADRDGTVFQRLEDLKQTITPIADWILTDKDDFDVADADADTDRWDVGYFSGAAGGSADINTTTSGHLYILADYDVAGAECYFVSHATPFYADNFIITEDVDCTWGATDSATPKAIGLSFSKGTTWDTNNYIVIERQKGTGVDRIQVRYNLNGAGEVTDDTAGNITDNAIAFKIERWDQTWRLYYSLTQNPDEEWVLAAQIEDSTDYMTNEVTFYHQAFNGAAGDATETAQGDFDFFRYYVGAGGGSQFLVGTYNSDWVTPDIDGNLFERDEATLKAIQIVDAGGTGFEEDGTGATVYKTLIAYEGLTTSAGTNSTIVDTVLTAKSANDLLGCQAIMLEGNNAGQSRTIKAFDGTSTITVEPNWLTTTSDASAYVILTKQGSLDIIASGNLTTDSATVPADTGRAEASNFFDGQILMPLTGTCAYEPRTIHNFNATGDIFTLDPGKGFHAAPGTVAYVIIRNQIAWVPTTDGTVNRVPAEAIGSKADTPDYNRTATTSSLQRLVKGLTGSRIIYVGTFTTSSATVPADTTAGAAYANKWFNGSRLIPVAGDRAFQSRRIIDFANTTGVFTISGDDPFTGVTGTVAYIVVEGDGGTVPGTDSVNNQNIEQSVGSKADTVDYSRTATTSSLQRLSKGLIGSRILYVGTFTTSSATVPADTVAGGLYADDWFVGDKLIPTAGDRAFQERYIADFANTTGVFSIDLDHAFTGVTGTVAYIIVAGDGGVSVAPAVDSVNVQTLAQTEGNKGDTAVFDHTSVIASNIALAKGILASITIETGTVSDVGAATTDFDTDLTEATTNHYNGSLLMFTNGDCVDQHHTIFTYTAANGNCAFAAGDQWTEAPANGDPFVILSANGGFLIKLYHMIGGANGIAVFPAAADIGNGVSLAEAIRAILTSMVGGDDYDGYTNISNSANASLNAVAQKFAAVIGIDAANTYAPTVNNSAQSTIEGTHDALDDILDGAGVANYPAAANPANSVSIAAVVRAIVTSLVGDDDYDGYTNINGTANTSLDAALQNVAGLFAAAGANTFNPTIQGAARTDMEVALNILASYFTAAGGAMALQLNNQTARTNLEQALTDYFTVWGMNGANVFDPTIDGVSQTTLEGCLDAVGTKFEKIQPSANSIDTIYDEVHANLDLAETDATTTTLDETEQTLYDESDTRPFEFRGGEVDLSAMADGDIVRFRIKTMASAGGTLRKISDDADWTFRDAQTEQPGVSFPGMSAYHGFRITIEHTLAAGAFDVVHSWRDAKAGN